jgi:hypothetical protein
MDATWLSIRTLGLTSKIWRKWRSVLKIPIMVKLWNITIFDIITDVCSSDMIEFAKIGFSKDDINTLMPKTENITIADVLVNMELNAHIIPHFRLSMQEWQELGLTVEHMRIMAFDDIIIIQSLGWIKNESDAASFEKLFGILPSELSNENMTRKKKTQTRKKTIASIVE